MNQDTIRGQDVAFVVAAVLCELYTASRLFRYIFTIAVDSYRYRNDSSGIKLEK